MTTSKTIAYQKEIEELYGQIAYLKQQTKMLFDIVVQSGGRPGKTFLSFYMSPSNLCEKYHVQNCHICELWECGDNVSPAKKRIIMLEQDRDYWKSRCLAKNKE